MTTRTFAVSLGLVAWCIGLAVHVNYGFYNRWALLVVTFGLAVSTAATLLKPVRTAEPQPLRYAVWLAAAGVLVDVVLMQIANIGRPLFWPIAVVGGLALLQAIDLGRYRVLAFGVLIAAFSVVATIVFHVVDAMPRIDVWVFQQMAADGLLHGIDPYLPRYPNLYGPGTPFYGPGVLDAANHLTVGLPYPPLSLLAVMPAYLLGGDCRYADIAAIAGSACLMAAAVPGRLSAIVSALFLTTPIVFYVIGQAWTDSLFVFTFSLVMFSAIRWRRALPYALGVFMATKQYAVLTIPLSVLLLQPGDRLKDLARWIAIGVALAAVVTLPFFLWSPYDFWRAVVQFQFMQPLRMDALSHLVWMRSRLPWSPLFVWIPFVAVVPAMALAIWRCPRTPAYFAGAVTMVHILFFAFSKQAFTNYYYFIVAAAAWASAASRVEERGAL